MANPFDQFDAPPQGNPFDRFDAPKYDKAAFASGPIKMGKDRFADDLRQVLQEAGWGERNIAGAGTALSNIWEGAKQFVGQGDAARIAANKVIEQEAPIGAFAGNAALTAVPFGMVGNGVKAAAGVGAAIGALNPVEGDQTIANVAKGKLINTAEGGVFGAAGQKLANIGGEKLTQILSERAIQGAKNAPRDKTISDAIAAGLVIPPSSVNPSFMTTLKEGIAGKIATAQKASNRNAEVFDDLARRAIGVAPDAPLTPEVTKAVRSAAYDMGYKPVAAVGRIPTDAEYHSAIDAIANKYKGVSRSFPGSVSNDIAETVAPFRVPHFDSEDAIGAAQFLRNKANSAFRAGNNDEGRAAKELSKALEAQIERNLQYRANGADVFSVIDSALGKRMSGADFDSLTQARSIAKSLKAGKITQEEAMQQMAKLSATSKTATDTLTNASSLMASVDAQKAAEMLKNFRDARQWMAKSHTVEDAIVEGGGTINPRKIAQQYQAGRPLSDELEIIGKFANNFPKAAQPSAQVAGPGVSKMNGLLSLLSGAGAASVGGPIGAAVGAAAPFVIPPAVRSRLLSKAAQGKLIPGYGPTLGNRLSAAMLENAPVGLTALGLEAFNQ